MLKKAILFFFIALQAAFVVGCDDNNDSDNVYLDNESTELVYEGLAQELTGTMAYSLTIGPLDVSDYDQIRISTSLETGSGTTFVQVYAVDEEGTTIGYIDDFDIVSGGVSEYSRVYDVPGQLIQISYDSSNNNFIRCLVYGR
ncbi:MAG TPA: hypothetical protein PK573_11685 [Spirochaetota bacterium]|nr:hypothetical protein [Spirochaetota bacterium]HRZ25761.1 hypothetical protein [Spirochaetota bacterium]HSA13218.1 hypothetical protein [Spirochaetota bacterium]